MSYSYQSYSHTTSSTSVGGRTHTTSTTRTTTSSSESGTVSSVVVRELSENELTGLSLETTQNYEITDDDTLTKYDFYALMNSEDEDDSETESESDVEYHWFPSLMKTSFIEFLDDKEQEAYMDDDTFDGKVQIEENDEFEDAEEEEEDEEEDEMHVIPNGKRYHHRHGKKHHHSKRPRRSEQVPVEVIHVVL